MLRTIAPIWLVGLSATHILYLLSMAAGAVSGRMPDAESLHRMIQLPLAALLAASAVYLSLRAWRGRRRDEQPHAP